MVQMGNLNVKFSQVTIQESVESVSAKGPRSWENMHSSMFHILRVKVCECACFVFLHVVFCTFVFPTVRHIGGQGVKACQRASLGKFAGFEENKSAFLIFYALVTRSLSLFVSVCNLGSKIPQPDPFMVHCAQFVHTHCSRNRLLTFISTNGPHTIVVKTDHSL